MDRKIQQLLEGNSLPMVSEDGAVMLPQRNVPIPQFISNEASMYLKASYHLFNKFDSKLTSTIDQNVSTEESHLRSRERSKVKREYALSKYPSTIRGISLGGVPVNVVTPNIESDKLVNDKAILYFSGGEFRDSILNDYVAINVAALCETRVYVPHYKHLGQDIEESINRQKQSIYSVYSEMCKLFNGSEIGVLGESLGAHAAISLVESCVTNGVEAPGALALVSVSGGAAESAALCQFLDPQSFYSRFTSSAAKNKTSNANDYKRVKETLFEREIEQFVFEAFPPTILISGTRDVSLSATVDLHCELTQLGRKAELSIYEGMPHAHYLLDHLPEAKEAVEELALFLRKYI